MWGDWGDFCKHTPVAGRTTDPEALNKDRAVDLFRSGLRSVHSGNVEEGTSLIATANIIQPLSTPVVASLPLDPEAKDYLLDLELLKQLANCDGGEGSPEGVVMRLFLSIYLPMNEPGGQEVRTRSLEESERLIKHIAANPVLEDEETGPLHGYLSRLRLHILRNGVYMGLGNRAKAAKELSAALKLDPHDSSVRIDRAMVYAGTNMKDGQFVVAELKRGIADAHPDSSRLGVAHLKLAHLVLYDPRLGTLDEARYYHNESRKARARFRELYGRTEGDNQLEASDNQVSSFLSDETKVSQRMLLDLVDVPAHLGARRARPSERHACLKCQKTERSDGGKLFKCSRCKLVSYCSKECQTEVRDVYVDMVDSCERLI